MLSRYHSKVTQEALAAFFDPASLREIIRANVRQDSLPSFFGSESRRHVCDCVVAESLAYIDEEHATIARLATHAHAGSAQRAALGRLLHTVQDFFAHTNYVALWRAQRGDPVVSETPAHPALDPSVLAHPHLQIAQWLTWREPLYYIPVVGSLLRKVWLPPASHEAINLDSPRRGDNFYLALRLAQHWTRTEYARAVANVAARGGLAAVARFRGLAAHASHPRPKLAAHAVSGEA